MIELEKLTKITGKKKRLNEVTLTIHKGELFGLLGANGAGKSTLLSILSLIHKPSSGVVKINGMDISSNAKEVRKMIGYVPQDLALWEDLSVGENMRFWSNFIKKPINQEVLMELCEAVQLRDKWDEQVANLSGGMKRKLNIAVALIHNPDILLMDEPTVGIDLQSKLEINQYVKKLAAAGKTIVYITHDLSEILSLCDRIGVLNDGILKFQGTLEMAMEHANKQGKRFESRDQLVYYLLNDEY